MPHMHRKGDICTGHGCFPPRASVQGSPDVFTNDIPQHRLTDGWSTHCCGPPCHASNLCAGSPNVFANNKNIGRKDDEYTAGHPITTGSPDVFANGD